MSASKAADEPMVPARGLQREWRLAGGVLGVVLVVLGVAWSETLASLVDLWTNSYEYGHGLIVAPVAVYLLWERRDRILSHAPAPSWIGALVVAFLIAVWFVSRLLGVLLGEQVAVVALLIAVIAAILGPRVAWTCTLPVTYLILAVPVWWFVNPYLQSWTAIASAATSRALGVPIYLEGLYMTIPDGQFLVANVCSGLRYLLASLSLVGFYAILNLTQLWRRITLVAIGVVVSVIFNWVRVSVIVLIGHHSKMQSPLVHQHVMLGWLLFIAVIVIILVCGRLLERGDADVAQGGTGQDQRPAVRREKSTLPTVGTGVLVAAMLAASPVLAMRVLNIGMSNAQPDLCNIAQGGTWTEGGGWMSPWRPRFRGAASEQTRMFSRSGTRIALYVAYYPVQRQGAEIVNDTNALYDRDAWTRVSVRLAPDQVEVGSGIAVTEFVLRAKGSAEHRLVWWLYYVGGSFTVDPLEAKWLQARGLINLQPEAAVIAVSTSAAGRRLDRQRSQLKSFLGDHLGEIRRRLERTAHPGTSGSVCGEGGD